MVRIFQTDITYETVSTVLNLYLAIKDFLEIVHSSADEGQFGEESRNSLLNAREGVKREDDSASCRFVVGVPVSSWCVRVQCDIEHGGILLDNRKLDLTWSKTLGKDFHRVNSWQKNSPEFSFFCCLETNISSANLHGGSLNRCKVLVLDKALHPAVGLAKEPQQGLPVVLPETLKLGSGREFTAREPKSDLHAAVPDVVVVLHTPCQRIPCSAICRSVFKLRSTHLTGFPCEHPPMVERVRPSQVFENVVIRCEGGR